MCSEKSVKNIMTRRISVPNVHRNTRSNKGHLTAKSQLSNTAVGYEYFGRRVLLGQQPRGNITSNILSDERNTWRKSASCVRACAGPLLRQARDHRRRRKSKPRTPPVPRNLAILPPQATNLTCVCACYKKLLPTTRQSQRSSGIRGSL